MLDRINSDIKTAMKAKEKEKLQALRYLKSMIMENNTSKKPSSELDVTIKYCKKLKDSLENFPEGNPLRDQTINELEFLKPYLPEQIEESDVLKIIEEIKASLESPNMGAIMKELQPKIKGIFDGKRASELVKAALS